MLEDPAKGAWGDKLRLQLAPGAPMASPLVRLALVAKDADAEAAPFASGELRLGKGAKGKEKVALTLSAPIEGGPPRSS